MALVRKNKLHSLSYGPFATGDVSRRGLHFALYRHKLNQPSERSCCSHCCNIIVSNGLKMKNNNCSEHLSTSTIVWLYSKSSVMHKGVQYWLLLYTSTSSVLVPPSRTTSPILVTLDLVFVLTSFERSSITGDPLSGAACSAPALPSFSTVPSKSSGVYAGVQY